MGHSLFDYEDSKLGKAGKFHSQAFRGSNLKYHLIRQLLESKDHTQIQVIKSGIKSYNSHHDNETPESSKFE